MCGIVGIIDRSKSVTASIDMFKFFEQALFADTVRGKHGTGIMAVDNAGNLEYYKRGLAAPDFLELPKTKEILLDRSNVFLVGHNRFATHGSHTCVNTHPFKHKNITLVHNGGISNYKNLVHPAKFEVDSEAIAYAFSTKDIKSVLEELDGAYSLVWYDSMTETLNFARNSDRPMWFGNVKGSDSMVFGSEPMMLRWLAARNGIDIEKMSELTVGEWITIPLDEKGALETENFTTKPKVVRDYYRGYQNIYEVKRENKVTKSNNFKYSYLINKPPIVVKATKWESFMANNEWGKLHCIGKEGNLKIIVTSFKEQQANELIGKNILVKVNSITSDLEGFGSFIKTVQDKHYSPYKNKENLILGPRALYISEDDFTKLCSDGCSVCGSKITIDDAGDLKWSSKDEPICKYCADYADKVLENFSRGV